nr:immunoglobulin light chain junction region [Macaca mulatta]MOX53132.1 immunoglobulin light chain junction region [Macaca mulatta]MOX53322.1 immunoglobulin light chain junction region [Macaca mulatta]MOX57748.1 immunoglobulin light chain junction region [Macaca mulatta]MOX58018.1 immunoglobulin light chain junction region [Macaca mulatta]
CLQYYIHPFTF